MEAVVLPLGNYWRSEGKQYRPFKKYLINILFLKDEEEFDELFSLGESNDYVTLSKANDYSWRKRRFKKGRAAILSTDEIDNLQEYVNSRKKEIEEEKKFDIIREKAEKLLGKLLEKYSDDNQDKNNGFSIEFNYYRIDYPNSIFIRYRPIDEFNENDSYNYLFTGYYKSDDDDGFEDTIREIDDLPEEDIIALLNKQDTEYDFVITSYVKVQPRLNGDVVSMYILLDGTSTTPEFELDSDWQKTLDRIIKLSDKCIEWQIDILEFSENLKKEVNPKYFELSKI